ncbi:Uncharacterised protein [Mycobacteroides abscessus subsp. abscessus]|nr:Uncharacterised protein [Mycobacteroides abscessus subsp. abscessus]
MGLQHAGEQRAGEGAEVDTEVEEGEAAVDAGVVGGIEGAEQG